MGAIHNGEGQSAVNDKIHQHPIQLWSLMYLSNEACRDDLEAQEEEMDGKWETPSAASTGARAKATSFSEEDNIFAWSLFRNLHTLILRR